MKKEILILIILLLHNGNCFAQDTIQIQSKGLNLKEKFIHKSEVVLKFKRVLNNSKKIDKSDLNKTEFYAKELISECKNGKFNKGVINNIKLKNDSLNVYLVRVLVSLESDIKLKRSKNVLDLYDELTLIEEQTFTQITEYNLLCRKSNMEELIFPVNTDRK